MKTELCSFCLKSGILCQKCSAKVKAGEISDLDLKVARLLLSLEEKYPSLQNVCFYKAIDVEKTLAILVGHGDVPKLLGYGGKIVKTIGDETNKNVRVLEHGVDDNVAVARDPADGCRAEVNVFVMIGEDPPEGEIRIYAISARGMKHSLTLSC